MKVAFVLSAVSNHGPFIVAMGIINNIHKLMSDPIDVFYLKDSDEKLEFEARCSKIGFLDKIDFNNYDIIHSHGFIADMYMALNRKRFNKVWITTMHQYIKPQYAMNYNFMTATLIEKIWCFGVNKSNCVVTLTEDMEKYYRCKIAEDKLKHIHNGVSYELSGQPIPADDLEKIKALKERYAVLGVSARLGYIKGVDLIIKALATEANSLSALIVIGDGAELENLKALAKQYDVGSRCLFLGYRRHVIDYYKYFDLYIMSSRSEAFGLCVIEAASQKIPVVCSNLVVYEELFTESEVVKFVIGNVESLSNAITSALNDKKRLSERIYQLYLKNYTATVMASKYFMLYEELIAGLSKKIT